MGTVGDEFWMNRRRVSIAGQRLQIFSYFSYLSNSESTSESASESTPRYFALGDKRSRPKSRERWSEVSTQETEAPTKRRSAILLRLGAALAILPLLPGKAAFASRAVAAKATRAAFDSDRITGKGVDNPTGHFETLDLDRPPT